MLHGHVTRSRCSYLARVKPILKPGLLADAGDDKAVDDVLGDRGEERQGHASTQHDEKSREVLDPHLQSLGQHRNLWAGHLGLAGYMLHLTE